MCLRVAVRQGSTFKIWDQTTAQSLKRDPDADLRVKAYSTLVSTLGSLVSPVGPIGSFTKPSEMLYELA